MGIGRVLGAVAPIAAGYFAPGSQFLTGASGLGLSNTAASIAAGAATGAGIAALSGKDPLMGGFTGGLGGMSGGSFRTAFNPGVAPKTTTAASNLENLRSANLAQAGQPSNIGMASNPAALGGSRAGTTFGDLNSFGPNMNQVNLGPQGPGTGMTAEQGTSGLETGGGYEYTTAEKYGMPEGSTTFMGGVRNLGGGSTVKGAGKLGITGLGVASSAGAFDPELPVYGENPYDRYDPKRRLNLDDINTGLNLEGDSGLRLLAEGGEVKKFVIGGSTGGPLAGSLNREYTPDQLSSLAEYGVVPQYQTSLYGMAGKQTAANRLPVTGIIDVGGKFVANPEGDITDVEYTKRFDYILNPSKTESDSGGDVDQIEAGATQGLGIGAAPALAIAQGYADQQQSPLESQTLGLEALAGGGYLETGGQVGDGMSDQIPANIDGMQEARLSDGEFVVPADVVSHLGNGSSDAGAKRLYEMMDKVRMARTGNKQQGKEIKPERYMPA